MSKKLSDDELKELFIKIVRPFEENGKKKYISYTSPHIEKIKEFITLGYVKDSNAKKQSIKNLIEPNKIIVTYLNNEKEIRALMRHLRNCIAHCKIKKCKTGNYYELEDSGEYKNNDKRKKSYFTMSGNIDINRLDCLLSYIHTENEKLNSIKNNKKVPSKNE